MSRIIRDWCADPENRAHRTRRLQEAAKTPEGQQAIERAASSRVRHHYPNGRPQNRKESWRASLLWAKYRLTLQDYDNLLIRQNGRCALCDRKPQKNSLHVDHDHRTKKVRGLLCASCNRHVGYFETHFSHGRLLAYLQQREEGGPS